MDWFLLIFVIRLVGISLLFAFYGYASVQLSTRTQRVLMWILAISSVPYLMMVYYESISENFSSKSSWLTLCVNALIPISFQIGRKYLPLIISELTGIYLGRTTHIKNEKISARHLLIYCYYILISYSLVEFSVIFFKVREPSLENLTNLVEDISFGLPLFTATMILWLLIWLIMKLIKRGSPELALVISITITVLNFSPIEASLTVRILHPFRAILLVLTALVPSSYAGLLLAQKQDLFPNLQQQLLRKMIIFCFIYNLLLGFFMNFMQLTKYSPGGYSYETPNNSELIVILPLLNLLYFSFAGNLLKNSVSTKYDISPIKRKRNRTVIMIIFSIFCFLLGLIETVGSILAIIDGKHGTQQNFGVFLGVLTIVTGYGVLRTEAWAVNLPIILVIFQIIFDLLLVFDLMPSELEKNIFKEPFWLVVYISIVVYFLRPKIKNRFGANT